MAVNLSKGQKISLEKEAGGALSQIITGNFTIIAGIHQTTKRIIDRGKSLTRKAIDSKNQGLHMVRDTR